jgi:hypothetical protein
MKWKKFEKQFSPARLARYKASFEVKDNPEATERKSAAAYAHNMLLAGSISFVLSVVEVAFRNSMVRELTAMYPSHENWWDAWQGKPTFTSEMESIKTALEALQNRNEACTKDKVVAELHFGFWCGLLNTKFQYTLWEKLRLGFPYCPQHLRQRSVISARMNMIRHLRNRVSHHEPLIWLTPTLAEKHAEIIDTIEWFNKSDLAYWAKKYDTFPAAWTTWQAEATAQSNQTPSQSVAQS